jgi:hypothetical protein
MRDGAPPGFTGGFGENDCTACHFEADVNPSPGAVTLQGVPASYAPGTTYPITVTVTRPAMKIGGFELTARFEESGAQAGSLVIATADVKRLKIMTDRGIQYATHTRDGTALASPDTARWTITWTAPAAGGAVLFNATANAANANDSQFGDYIYATSAKSGAVSP